MSVQSALQTKSRYMQMRLTWIQKRRFFLLDRRQIQPRICRSFHHLDLLYESQEDKLTPVRVHRSDFEIATEAGRSFLSLCGIDKKTSKPKTVAVISKLSKKERE